MDVTYNGVEGSLDVTYNGVESKATSANPKDSIGSTKVSISKFPVIATIMGSMAMMDGAEKYGPYNWRDKPVIASIYYDAAMRHWMTWYEGQEEATDSKVHHLGHAIACAAIILDAQAHGNLIDDRPIPPSTTFDETWLSDLLDELSAIIKRKKELKAQ